MGNVAAAAADAADAAAAAAAAADDDDDDDDVDDDDDDEKEEDAADVEADWSTGIVERIVVGRLNKLKAASRYECTQRFFFSRNPVKQKREQQKQSWFIYVVSIQSRTHFLQSPVLPMQRQGHEAEQMGALLVEPPQFCMHQARRIGHHKSDI